MEDKYRDSPQANSRSSSVLGFGLLLVLNLTFAYLEYKALGRESSVPMYGYAVVAFLTLANLLISLISRELFFHNIRLLANCVVSICLVILAVYVQKYIAYHTVEMVLLVFLLGNLNAIRHQIAVFVNLLLISLFVAVMIYTGVSTIIASFAFILLFCALIISICLSYLFERQRRILFLQTDINTSMNQRQENWSFCLIDLDMALSGIFNFKELIGLLEKHLETVIEFDSYILTSLEGQGPKPVADEMKGDLFEKEDRTLWPEDLLIKLTQTRQATVSTEIEAVSGWFGIRKEQVSSYRLDIPVFNDSKMLGVISLRRSVKPFDDLDMVAGVSIATQAMLIFKRTVKSSAQMMSSKIVNPVVRQPLPKQNPSSITQFTSQASTDIELSVRNEEDEKTADTNPDGMMAPNELVKKIRQEEETAKKTITLLSRENADKIAVDKYRSAAVEGESLSVLVIEVDGLSKMREQDGDQVAYKVFAAIVKYIYSTINKEKDILGRYGQNGLSILMPKVDMNAAEKFAEATRQYVEKTRYKTAYGEKSATLSIGVAAITDDTGDYNSMVKRADMALFVAKKNGRNCVKVRL